MSININLSVATLTSRTGIENAVKQILQHVASPLIEASNQDIDLQISTSGKKFGPEYDGLIQSDQLHTALECITGYQRNRTKVTNIGLLVADRYEPRPDFFGYMFDDDFAPGFPNPWATTPREGCAVFIGGIAARRDGQEFLDEVIYTAIHEVGHIFNLQHANSPSYMAQSAGLTHPYNLNKTRFGNQESFLLSQCSSSPFVWPGGSLFGDLGPFFSETGFSDAANSSPLQIKIDINRAAFWYFEPIELDIELSTKHVPVSIPDMVDPGYKAFTVWIEEPSGERRRYRSPKHYCPSKKKVTISPSNPFRRDISIFGESGGYAFRKAGMHRIWVTFNYGRGKCIDSNVVEVELLSTPSENSFFSQAVATFTDHNVGRLLYHRRLTRSRAKKLALLTSFCEAFPRHPSVAMAHYSIGRALASLAREKHRVDKPIGHLVRDSKLHLQKAAVRVQLGEHRQQLTEDTLKRLSNLKM